MLSGNTLGIPIFPHKFIMIAITCFGAHVCVIKGCVRVCRNDHMKSVFKSTFYGSIDTVIGLQTGNNELRFLLFTQIREKTAVFKRTVQRFQHMVGAISLYLDSAVGSYNGFATEYAPKNKTNCVYGGVRIAWV